MPVGKVKNTLHVASMHPDLTFSKAYSLPNSDYDMDQISELFNTNVVSVIAMCKAFTPLLIASGHGRIVNMSSILSFLPLPFAAAYCATKAALNAYGDSLRVELKPFKSVFKLPILSFAH